MSFRTFSQHVFSLILGAVVLLAASGARADVLYNWSASSGLFPDQVATSTGYMPVTLTDTASPENPAFSGGALQISTDQYVENMYYTVPLVAKGNEASLGQLPLSIEFKLKITNAGRSDTRRAGVVVSFSDGGVGNALQIYTNEIFISNGNFSRGASAGKTTTDDFHTYRIEIGGYSTGSSYSVYFDNAALFSGSLYADPSDNGPATGPATISFGEGSSLAYGTSLFQSFQVSTVPEPATWAWLGVAALAGGSRILRRRACIARRSE